MQDRETPKTEDPTNPEQEAGIISGKIVILPIPQVMLSLHQEAGQLTKYNVSVIAETGQPYLCLDMEHLTRSQRLITTKLVPDGFVAISIEPPEDRRPPNTRYDSFWKQVHELLQQR